jgi:hypothetical protein
MRYRRTIIHAYFTLMGRTTLDGECWVKKRPVTHRPFVMVEGRRYLASRVVLLVHKKLDIENRHQLACHTCHNPLCYNPDHLYVGDKSTNATDVYKSHR